MWPFNQLIEAWTFARTKFPEPPPPSFSPPFVFDQLARKALVVALAELQKGCGEQGGNNLGPDVERYISPAKAPQNWCAGFSGWCYEEAARHLGVPLPFRRSLGAKALGKNVAAVGRKFTDPKDARPGDLIIFDRGTTGSWQGHVGLVEEVEVDLVHTVEGNSAPQVRRRIHRIGLPTARFSFFASIRR
jgi:hypothetical protein